MEKVHKQTACNPYRNLIKILPLPIKLCSNSNPHLVQA